MGQNFPIAKGYTVRGRVFPGHEAKSRAGPK